ncbi:MFS transporter [Paenibacillus donghaensis]|uniref:MFS transporter n=1 Tax=Paenibacillus donghaensis TaxID=414771 RepID=A0A2Z2KYZ1_9BACL|nr:MFS transporter [Paenibacillus donghaensis]ASA25978.1 MFS transporter [Paenibacillus donghaensis]
MGSRAKQILSFTAIVLGFFMALLDTTIINVALPEMTHYFGGDVSQLSWVMNGYNLAFAVFILTASRLADQFGRRRVFLIGIGLFTVASLLAGLSTSLEMLIVCRVLQGLAGAIIVPVTIPLTTTTFPKELHGMIIGIWGVVSGLAAASGPALGGMITEKLNWQWIFFVNVPLGIASIVLTLIFIKESRDDTAGHNIDWGGILGISGGMFCLTYALIKVEQYGWGSQVIWMLLSAAVISLLFFFLTQWKGKEPMLPLSLLKIGTFNGASLTMLVVGAALMNIALLTSFFLTRMMGMSELKAGLVLSMLAVGSIVSSGLAGPLSNKYGSRWFAAAGIVLMAGATYSLGGLHADSSVGDVLLRLIAAGFGVGLTMAPVMSSAIRNVPADKVGVSSGVINMMKALGSVLGVAIIVTVLQQNMDNRLESAHTEAIAVVQQDQAMLPFVRESLSGTLDNWAGNGTSSTRITTGGEQEAGSAEGLYLAAVENIEVAAASLTAEQQAAFGAARAEQYAEVQLVLPGVGQLLREAPEQAFSRTFAMAGYMLIPGILFALLSDRRRMPAKRLQEAVQVNH